MDDAGNADLDLGHAEFGVVRGDPEVAGGSELESATKAPAGHPGDHRPRKDAHRLAEITEARDKSLGGDLIEPGHFLDVGAADHALFAVAGDHQHADLPVRRERLQPLAHPVDRLPIRGY